MASIIKANQLQDFGGNSIIGSDGAGNLTTQKINYPAFEAYLSADQTVSDAIWTKMQINTEVLDTDNCYDNSTNYRFTPTVAGKYFVYMCITGDSTASGNCHWVFSRLYKNGSAYKQAIIQFTNNEGRQASVSITAIIDMNGSSDYLEAYGGVNTNGTTAEFHGDNTYDKCTYFGAYRIGS